VRVPKQSADHVWSYLKFRRRSQDWATVGVAAVVKQNGHVEEAAVALIEELVAGFRVTLGRRILPAHDAPPDTGFALVLNRKYYIDELYDRVVVRPLVWLSRVVLWKGVDQGVVDGAAVNGTARVSRALGWLGSRLQTGQVGIYVVLFLVGALWILRAVVR